MKTKFAVAPLAALAFFAAACADSPTGPSRALLPEAASLAVTHQLINFAGGAPWPTGFEDGYVVLCKTGDAPGSFTFNVAVNGGTAFQVTRTLTAQTLTDCGAGPVYISGVDNTVAPETVVITEVGQPNWALTGIDIVQLLGQGIFNRGEYVAPRLNDSENGTTASLYINDDMARKVTFTNDYTAPPPPPPPAVCDFITFGRLELSTEAGVKVVVSGNAGGNNADGSIKNEFHIAIGEKKAAIDYHVADAVTYGPIANAPLQTGASPLFPNSRMVTGTAKNGMFVELRLWDGGEPGKGTDMVYYRITDPANGNALVATLGPKLIDQGNMQYHANCRGPDLNIPAGN